jgi:hypothetical protein
VRAVALELAPLVADKDIDFDIATQPAPVRAHEWMLSELSRNLLHNAIKHSRAGRALSVRVFADARARRWWWRQRAPASPPSFSRGCSSPSPPATCAGGSGLGLAISHEIVRSARRGDPAGKSRKSRIGTRPGCHGAACRWRRMGADGKTANRQVALERALLQDAQPGQRGNRQGPSARQRREVKPAREVKVGDTVALRREGLTRTVAGQGPVGTCAPAPVAQELYEKRPGAAEPQGARRSSAASRRAGAGDRARPTKRGRRELDEAATRWLGRRLERVDRRRDPPSAESSTPSRGGRDPVEYHYRPAPARMVYSLFRLKTRRDR